MIYIYSKISEIPNLDNIIKAILNSTMTNKAVSSLRHDVDTQNLEVIWTTSLSSSDKNILDSIIINTPEFLKEINYSQALPVEYKYIEYLPESSANTVEYETKMDLVVTPETTGFYKLEWYYEYSTSSESKNIFTQVLQDNEIVLSEIATLSFAVKHYMANCGFAILELTNQPYTFTIQFKGDEKDYTIYIKNSRLVLTRVI